MSETLISVICDTAGHGTGFNFYKMMTVECKEGVDLDVHLEWDH